MQHHFSGPTRRQFLALSGLALAASRPVHALAADAWPTRPVRLVVPFAAGGSSEIVARSAAAEMSKILGQNVYVENRPGAGGNIAMQEVAGSEDGHTIILGHVGTMAVNPFMYAKIPYDPIRQFTPVALLASVPALIVVHPDVPARSIPEFIALARKSPGALNYGSGGNGSGGHLAFEYLKLMSNTSIAHIPYKGGGPLLVDLLSGRLQACCLGASALLQHVKAGKLRAIGATSGQRIAQLPQVPTVAEQGYKGYEFNQWYGLLAPASWPRENVAKLEAAAIQAVKSNAVTTTLSEDMAKPEGKPSIEFVKLIASEQARWKPVVVKAQIRAD